MTASSERSNSPEAQSPLTRLFKGAVPRASNCTLGQGGAETIRQFREVLQRLMQIFLSKRART
jgi:hypothetical protein